MDLILKFSAKLSEHSPVLKALIIAQTEKSSPLLPIDNK